MNKTQDSESGHSQVILAAGGIVKRVTENGIEILLIQRERYGTEWCLPKGKLNNNESISEAAIREIYEETGCTVELLRFIDADIYSTKDNIKCVFYWLCQVTDEGNFVASEEVKEIAWMTPQQAVTKLTHKGQRDLVRKTVCYVNRPGGIMQRLSYLYSRYIDRKRWKRLDSSIASYRNELDCKYIKTQDTSCVHNVYAALDDAIAALSTGEIDKGWKCFHSAQRIELLMLNNKEDKDILMAKVIQIRNESVKLNNWRKAAIMSLLPENIAEEKLLPKILFDAALIRDEHYDNQAYKDELRRCYDTSLVILMASILVWLYCAYKYDFISFDGEAEFSSTVLVGVVSFGVFGALFSAIIKSADNSNNSSRIPEMTLAIHITLLRIVLGAASAVIVYIILQSGLVSILSEKITEIVKDMAVATVYVIAFVSGTSERLVLRAIENINKS